MGIFWSVTGNEFSKLWSRKKFFVFLLIEIAGCALVAGIDVLLRRLSDGTLSLARINLSLIMLTVFIQGYIPLVIFMAATDLFSSEFADSSIRAALMRPVSRFKVYLAKVSAVMLMALTYLAALFLLSTILDVSIGGGLTGIFRSLGAYILDVVPIIVVVLMSAFLNQLTKSGTLAMFMTLLIYIVLCVLGIFVPQVGGLLFTGYTQWHSLWLANTMPVGAMLAKLGIIIGYAVVFLTAGYYLFDRRDI